MLYGSRPRTSSSRRRHNRAVIRAHQVAQRVLDPHHGLLDKCHPRRGAAGRLRLNREPAGGCAADNKRATDRIGKIGAAGRQLLGPNYVDPQVGKNGHALARVRANVQ